jgi:hypothetical protein
MIMGLCRKPLKINILGLILAKPIDVKYSVLKYGIVIHPRILKISAEPNIGPLLFNLL